MAEVSLHRERLRLRHLRLLDLIDRHRSLRAVAETLNLTQPAVSQMVKDLEHAFGVALVDRSVKGAVLTPKGVHALQRARAGLAIFDHLSSELAGGSDGTLLLRIGTNPALTYHVLPRALALMEEPSETPVRFAIRSGVVGDMTQQLLDGTIDCYVGRMDWEHVPQAMAPLLHLTPVLETEFVIVCSDRHPLAGRAEVGARELLDWPWALTTLDTNNRRTLDAAFRDRGLTPPMPAVEIKADPYALLAMTQHLDMLTCIPRAAFVGLNQSGHFRALCAPDLRLAPIQTVFLTLRANEGLTALRLLRQALLSAVGD